MGTARAREAPGARDAPHGEVVTLVERGTFDRSLLQCRQGSVAAGGRRRVTMTSMPERRQGRQRRNPAEPLSKGSSPPPSKEDIMEIVRVTEADELSAEDQRFC
jgi:hypothetical protein